jgi:hypothetical protein
MKASVPHRPGASSTNPADQRLSEAFHRTQALSDPSADCPRDRFLNAWWAFQSIGTLATYASSRKNHSAPSIVCMAQKLQRLGPPTGDSCAYCTDITDSSGHSAAVNDGASIWFRVDCHLFNLHQALRAEAALLSAHSGHYTK